MRPEYPRSLHEFRKLFADEAACRLYLARSRWPEEGPVSEVRASRGARAADAAPVAVPGMRARHLRHCGDSLAPNPGPVDAVVLGCLSGRDSDAGLLGTPAPAAVGDPPVRDDLGDAAEAASGHGAAGS